MVLLELDVLPERPQEADALVRLRLRKSLPFDVAKARVSWQAQKVNGKTTVLAAAALTTVLEEYESLVREAGYSPGLMLPSVLASLRAVDASVPTLLIKIDPATTGIAIVSGAAVVLLRILGRTPGQDSQGAQLAREVHSSLMFLQDAHGSKVTKILIGGAVPMDVNAAIEESTSIRAQELVVARPQNIDSTIRPALLGAVSGALA
jgi:type IV pilus assembly protein PilM